MTACRSCGAEIFFAHTANGKMMPLEIGPTGEGNVVVNFDGPEPVVERVYGEQQRHEALAAGAELYLPHFAPCQDAALWRTRGSS